MVAIPKVKPLLVRESRLRRDTVKHRRYQQRNGSENQAGWIENAAASALKFCF
jgi:hypothetical protein